MKGLRLVTVVLAFALVPYTTTSAHDQDNNSKVNFIPVGCYKDLHRPDPADRPLPELVKSYRDPDVLDWENLDGTVIQPCAKAVNDKGYLYFGIQFYGECWSGDSAHRTYAMDGISQDCSSGVGKAYAIKVYRIIGEGKECLHYTNLTDPHRAKDFTPHTDKYNRHCDREEQTIDHFIPNRWYRFTGLAGDRMPTECTLRGRCGTIETGWMKGVLPNVTDGAVDRKVCFSGSNDGLVNCGCGEVEVSIRVRDCGGFYVYRLPDVPGCYRRYCGNGA